MFGFGKDKDKEKNTNETPEEKVLESIAEGDTKTLGEQKENKFAKRVTPKKINENNADELFMFRCECGHVHCRHAGYIEILVPYMMGNKEDGVQKESCQVMICVKCKRAYIWVNGQMYDVTDMVDLEAWEKTEKEAYKTTGPGGQC